MDLIEKGIAGFIKPLIDLIFSIFIYAITQAIIGIQTAVPSSSTSIKTLGFTFDPLIFLSVFGVVTISEEIVLGMQEGYFEPLDALAKSGGILLGTYLFWGALIQTQKTIGGSEFDAIFSEVIAIGAMLLGLYIRVRLSKR